MPEPEANDELMPKSAEQTAQRALVRGVEQRLGQRAHGYVKLLECDRCFSGKEIRFLE